MLTKKANLLRVINNIYFKKKEPVSLVHFITNRCNARCSFCFIDFDDPNTFKGELSLDEINKLTKNLGKSLLNVNLTGGEPFARKDIIDIAKLYIKNTTIQSIYITTNASLPNRVIDFAKDKPPRIGDVGLYALHDKEMVLSAQDTLNFAKNIYAGGFGTGAGGGNITIVNAPSQPVTNLAQSSTNINEIHVPESAINYERTFRTMAHGQMAYS